MNAKKSRYSSLQRALVWMPFIALLILAGCQQRNEVIAGVEVPIPAKMTKNSDKVFDPIPEFKDGQVSYQGKVRPSEIFIFTRKSWRPKVGNPRRVSRAIRKIPSATQKGIG